MRLKILLLCLSLLTTQAQYSFAEVTPDTMKLIHTINGSIAPKSVRSSGDGVVSAHNMMYRHSVTVYDAKSFELLHTVSDSVSLKDFGFSKTVGNYKGSPVEGTFSPDGKYLYVSNYAMYGKGFNKEGTDTCSPADGYDKSFVYRINRSNYQIDSVYPVGSVPKVVEVTPDNKYVLVANWCSYTVSVISVEKNKIVKTIKIGRYPRGIAVNNDSTKAYVAEMGGNRIHVINLEDFSTSFIPTGNAARSLAISKDGSALYVVNYKSDTMSRVRTSDMKVTQNIKVCNEPIGITYDVETSNTWVACYKGQIKIYSNN
jgi:YVTN family beta-propeller protein